MRAKSRDTGSSVWVLTSSEYEHISLGFSYIKHKSLRCTRLGKLLLHNLIILIRHSTIDREACSACSASLLSSQGHQLSNVRKIVELVNSKPNISQKIKIRAYKFYLDIMEQEIGYGECYLLFIMQIHI